jgi:hypothetical protein
MTDPDNSPVRVQARVLLRTSGLTFAVAGTLGIVMISVYGFQAGFIPYPPVVLSVPSALLVLCLWGEKRILCLMYLCILAGMFSVLGLVAVVQRLSYYRSTFDRMYSLTVLEAALLFPVLVWKVRLLMRGRPTSG